MAACMGDEGLDHLHVRQRALDLFAETVGVAGVELRHDTPGGGPRVLDVGVVEVRDGIVDGDLARELVRDGGQSLDGVVAFNAVDDEVVGGDRGVEVVDAQAGGDGGGVHGGVTFLRGARNWLKSLGPKMPRM